MSRGLGRIEQRVLSELKAAPNELDVFVLSAKVYGQGNATQSQLVSVRRALSSLVAKRYLIDPGRNWRDGRKRWSLRAEM